MTLADHQRVYPAGASTGAAGDVEAPPPPPPPPPPVHVPPVPLVVPLPQGRRYSSSTHKEKEKVKVTEPEKTQLLQHNNHSAPLQSQVRTSTSTSTSVVNQVIHANPPKKRSSSSSCTWCRRMCWTMGILLLVLITIGASVGILYLIFQPKLPNYSVDSLKISDLRLNLDMTLYAKFDVKITANNPNKKIGIYYEQGGRLSVWYTNTKLCQGTLPKFYQGHQNKTLLNVALTGQTQYGSTLMNALQQQQQTGRIPLDLKVDAPVAIKLGKLKLRKVRILGECLLVVDSLTTNNLISINANNCRFRLKL